MPLINQWVGQSIKISIKTQNQLLSQSINQQSRINQSNQSIINHSKSINQSINSSISPTIDLIIHISYVMFQLLFNRKFLWLTLAMFSSFTVVLSSNWHPSVLGGSQIPASEHMRRAVALLGSLPMNRLPPPWGQGISSVMVGRVLGQLNMPVKGMENKNISLKVWLRCGKSVHGTHCRAIHILQHFPVWWPYKNRNEVMFCGNAKYYGKVIWSNSQLEWISPFLWNRWKNCHMWYGTQRNPPIHAHFLCLIHNTKWYFHQDDQ